MGLFEDILKQTVQEFGDHPYQEGQRLRRALELICKEIDSLKGSNARNQVIEPQSLPNAGK